jgi:hypothetical protein
MEFYYEVIITEHIDIDFNKIYNRVVEELKNLDTISFTNVCDEFLNNMVYYLQELYNCKDLVEEDNTYVLEELADEWEEWLDEKFKEKDLN